MPEKKITFTVENKEKNKKTAQSQRPFGNSRDFQEKPIPVLGNGARVPAAPAPPPSPPPTAFPKCSIQFSLEYMRRSRNDFPGDLTYRKPRRWRIYEASVKYVCRNSGHFDRYQGEKMDSFIRAGFVSSFYGFLKLINLFLLC